MKKLFYLGLFILAFSSCEKETQSEIDEQKIKSYLTENEIDATAHDSGIYFIITKEGTGGSPNISSSVEVNYKGYLTDGSVFDETSGNSAIFPLQNLILGWQIGIPLLEKGGEGTFFIPSELGYGTQAIGSIPANSVLIFEIELLDFQ
ncbi:MAG: peptidylprolyl isomerase [Bacteroidetes bacterium]|jgi:FKBP-type peptidyl-prolyl cis-trans isomerase FkpA|nr:peptidylprolyl isomerase [Bacteroidota bacterium]MBT6687581.1 peptidylprolyl isomerase [Bacteroidota bacterium]MBT7143580.1 peptidylprolyl isomerase [Bacteroidota bacterium]MBT7492176.1 peptidylprolyl isomerase [Bacteroidota bacterium]